MLRLRHRVGPYATVLALLLVGTTIAVWLARTPREPPSTAPSTGPASGGRIVSLFPPATETIFAIGAGAQLVGRSDYCRFPPEARHLPQAGTSLRPNTEVLVRLRPSIVVTKRSVQNATQELAAVAPLELLPWLTLPEIAASIRRLGRVTGRQQAADALADKLVTRLDVPEPREGPRVLLAMGQAPGNFSEVWFLRKNSIHGAALHAAGGRNAVDRDVTGTPNLSLERVVHLDPDIVIVLSPDDELSGEARAQLLKDWGSLSTMQAVTHNRIRVHQGAWLFSSGPLVLELVDLLKRDLRELAPK